MLAYTLWIRTTEEIEETILFVFGFYLSACSGREAQVPVSELSTPKARSKKSSSSSALFIYSENASAANDDVGVGAFYEGHHMFAVFAAVRNRRIDDEVVSKLLVHCFNYQVMNVLLHNHTNYSNDSQTPPWFRQWIYTGNLFIHEWKVSLNDKRQPEISEKDLPDRSSIRLAYVWSKNAHIVNSGQESIP